jgi:hypothetical protein
MQKRSKRRRKNMYFVVYPKGVSGALCKKKSNLAGEKIECSKNPISLFVKLNVGYAWSYLTYKLGLELDIGLEPYKLKLNYT